MNEKILALLFEFVTHVIRAGGYAGIVALMGIESACIPLPSEIIMPFAGYLVFKGYFNLFWVATAGAAGCNLGSLVAYWIGARGGRPLVERYGNWVLMSHRDLDRMTRFFEQHGSITVLLARLLAGQLYLVTVQHEILGSHLWDYQLWTHRQPARVYSDFRREPLDVYQRLVNANYNLNVHRRALMDDFNRVALDYRARAALLQFQSDLAALEAAMDSQPGAVWRLYPRELKVNINA